MAACRCLIAARAAAIRRICSLAFPTYPNPVSLPGSKLPDSNRLKPFLLWALRRRFTARKGKHEKHKRKQVHFSAASAAVGICFDGERLMHALPQRIVWAWQILRRCGSWYIRNKLLNPVPIEMAL